MGTGRDRPGLCARGPGPHPSGSGDVCVDHFHFPAPVRQRAKVWCGMLELTLRPHRERGGYHLDRFDVCLGDDLVCVSRSGWHEPARKLIDAGHAPETLMVVRHEGREADSSVKPRSLGEAAEWTVGESDRGGLTRRRWVPFDASVFNHGGGEDGDGEVSTAGERRGA